MSNSNIADKDAAADVGIAAALRAMPQKNPPAGGWQRVLARHGAGHGAVRPARFGRRRYWGRGLAVAASLAVAIVGLRLGAGVFFGAADAGGESAAAGLLEAFPDSAAANDRTHASAPAALEDQLAEMDMDALVAFSRFQEERLRALPVAGSSRSGGVVRMDTFGLATELEDTIAALDEGLTQVSLSRDAGPPARTLLQQRAVLMDELWTLRQAEASRAGFIYASY